MIVFSFIDYLLMLRIKIKSFWFFVNFLYVLWVILFFGYILDAFQRETHDIITSLLFANVKQEWDNYCIILSCLLEDIQLLTTYCPVILLILGSQRRFRKILHHIDRDWVLLLKEKKAYRSRIGHQKQKRKLTKQYVKSV